MNQQEKESRLAAASCVLSVVSDRIKYRSFRKQASLDPYTGNQ